jgi:hypothetical protein
MIAQRKVVTVKPGYSRNKVMDLVLAELVKQRERGSYSHPFRAYAPVYSGQPENTLILEWEYEDMTEIDKVVAEWWALPTTPAFMEKWREMTESLDSNEIWSVRVP